ncbi:hypothetical protein V2J09_023936 [Rumex salicifolius]
MSPLPLSERKYYPTPLAGHEEVVAHPKLFWDTLKSFHTSFGTKFMVPVIGGKELDLHLLYVEVTRRGGYEKVVSEKKWREISSVFSFAPTATSASFVLKKHYQSLLHHYEQAYFFKLPVFTLKTPLLHAEYQSGPDMFDNEDSSKSCDDFAESPSGGPRSFLAEGTIDGKFDCGYLISMKMGSEVLRGILYHPQKPAISSPETADLGLAIVPYDPKTPRARRRRFKKKRWGGDPTHPKPNRSGYNFFFAERHAMLKSIHPNREREFTKMIGEAWNNLNATERLVYQKIGLEDKERYQRELKEYKERKLIQQPQGFPGVKIFAANKQIHVSKATTNTLIKVRIIHGKASTLHQLRAQFNSFHQANSDSSTLV